MIRLFVFSLLMLVNVLTQAWSQDTSPTERVIMTVALENENDDNIIIRKDFNSIAEIPEVLNNFIPGDFVYRPDSGFTLLISLPNDHILASVWNYIFDTETDDRGQTHGFALDLIMHTQNRVNIGLHIGTDLFTYGLDRYDGADGLAYSPQYFTNENIIALIADNRYQGNLFYWATEVGHIRLNSQTTGRWQATGHQRAWHDLLTSIDPSIIYIPENVTDGRGIRDGFLLGASLGVQYSWYNRYFYFRPYFETSFRMNIFNDDAGINDLYHRSSFVQLRAGAEFVYQRSPHTVPLRVELYSTARFHQAGVSLTPALSIVTGRTLQIGFEYSQQYFNVQNYQEYNLPVRAWNSDTGVFEEGRRYEPMGTIFIRGRMNRDERLMRMRQQRRENRRSEN